MAYRSGIIPLNSALQVLKKKYLLEKVLTLFQLGRDSFYHRESISLGFGLVGIFRYAPKKFKSLHIFLFKLVPEKPNSKILMH